MSNKYLFIVGSILVIACAIIGISFASDNTMINKNIVTTNTVEKPSDFVQVQRDIKQGVFLDLCDVKEGYYRQPELYFGYNTYLVTPHDYTRWIVHGYGAYPGEASLSVSNMKAGETITVCTLIHTSFGVETYQGIGLSIEPNDYFTSSITPNSLLLYPTFPKITGNWTYKIAVTIIAKQDIQPGSYTLNMMATAPDTKTSQENYNTMNSLNQSYYNCPDNTKCNPEIIELRKRVYVDGGQFSTTEFYKISIAVT